MCMRFLEIQTSAAWLVVLAHRMSCIISSGSTYLRYLTYSSLSVRNMKKVTCQSLFRYS